MPATVRRMRSEEAEAVEALFQEYMGIDTSRREAILENLGREDSEILVAEAQGNVIGVGHQVFYIDPLHAGKCSNILFLYVAKPFRRQGIGKSLLKRMLDSATDRGVLEVHVSTRADNEAAIRLYKESGFEHAGPLFEFNPSKQTEASFETVSA